ncbi:MAG: hypothetical protein A4E64_00278 [Syntrophorhabdus sp. PtaU1.Bin058]|nr:MAG: hypothetical protein A4E64_00278 [Syntrophorhabdus sp. PtaU1.Bin058]
MRTTKVAAARIRMKTIMALSPGNDMILFFDASEGLLNRRHKEYMIEKTRSTSKNHAGPGATFFRRYMFSQKEYWAARTSLFMMYTIEGRIRNAKIASGMPIRINRSSMNLTVPLRSYEPGVKYPDTIKKHASTHVLFKAITSESARFVNASSVFS